MKALISSFLILAAVQLANARLVSAWSYKDLYRVSDLVVLVTVVYSQETSERTILPDITPDVHVSGLSAECGVRLVLKGDKNTANFVLHYYKLTDPTAAEVDGPSLPDFDLKPMSRYLMFLRREPDGRYAPLAGQTDPRGISIQKLDGDDFGDATKRIQ